MTTSLSVTRNSIIAAALRLIGAIGQGQTPSTEDYTFCSEALNLMIKGWITNGATLWKIANVEVPMIEGVVEYPLGQTAAYVYEIQVTNGGSGYDGTSTITLSAPGTFSGFSNVTATASLNITGGAITSVTITNPGSGYQTAPTITLGGNGAGATLNAVIVGKTMVRPMRIVEQGNFIRNASNQDTPVRMIGRNEYLNYGNKFSPGIVNSFYYDPQLSNGILYVYTAPEDSTTSLFLQAHIQFEDMTAAADAPDFPQEWFILLKYGLARELVIEYGVDQITEARIERRFREAMSQNLSFSVEEASTTFVYDGGR